MSNIMFKLHRLTRKLELTGAQKPKSIINHEQVLMFDTKII